MAYLQDNSGKPVPDQSAARLYTINLPTITTKFLRR